MIRVAAGLVALAAIGYGGEYEAEAKVDADFTGPLMPISPTLALEHSPRSATGRLETAPVKATRAEVHCLEAGPDGRVTLRFGRSANPPTVENPFDCRLRESSQSEQRIRVGLVVLGRRALAILNGQTLGEGMRIAGFNVVAIETDAVLLERNGQCFRVRAGAEVRVTEETTR
jgi:hypothetical protein